MTSTATASPDHCNRILNLVPLPALDEVRHKFLAAYSPKGALKLAEGQGMQYKLSPLPAQGGGGYTTQLTPLNDVLTLMG